MANWFAVWVMTGEELALQPKVQAVKGITEALVPLEHYTERINNAWVPKERVMIPSYIFVRCGGVNNVIYDRVKEINGVIGWLGKYEYWVTSIPEEQMAPLIALAAGGDPAQLLREVKINKRQHRGTGTLRIGGVDHKIIFALPEARNETDKQAEDNGDGAISPEDGADQS